MKTLWSHKLLVTIGALVIFLSVGAVAFAATNGDDETSSFNRVAALVGQTGTGSGPALGEATPAERREAQRERIEQRRERQKALMELLREEMTDADQEQYDELVESIEEQQAELKEAREELADTLKELRELVKRYLPAPDSNN